MADEEVVDGVPADVRDVARTVGEEGVDEGPQAETAEGAELDSHAARSCSRRSCSSREASPVDEMEREMKESISIVRLGYELIELGYALGVKADRWTRR